MKLLDKPPDPPILLMTVGGILAHMYEEILTLTASKKKTGAKPVLDVVGHHGMADVRESHCTTGDTVSKISGGDRLSRTVALFSGVYPSCALSQSTSHSSMFGSYLAGGVSVLRGSIVCAHKRMGSGSLSCG